MNKKKIIVTGAAAAGALVMTAGLATASVPSADGVVHGCRNARGALRVIDTEAGARCARNEVALDWSQRGPVGPKGEDGATGARGPRGPAGVARVYVVARSRQFNPGDYWSTDYATLAAACAAGDRVLSGGFAVPSTNLTATPESEPVTTSRWQVTIRVASPARATYLTVTAVCLAG